MRTENLVQRLAKQTSGALRLLHTLGSKRAFDLGRSSTLRQMAVGTHSTPQESTMARR